MKLYPISLPLHMHSLNKKSSHLILLCYTHLIYALNTYLLLEIPLEPLCKISHSNPTKTYNVSAMQNITFHNKR